MENRAKAVAEILLDLGAVEIRSHPPFTWASGRFSPVYCDNRLVLSDVESRRRICDYLIDIIAENTWKPQCIAGTATAGIPHAAWIADRLNLPLVYIRAGAKAHGKARRVEGRLEKGSRVVVIEDLISTGGSSVSAAGGVDDEGGKVEGVAAIFTYGLNAASERFRKAGFSWSALCDFTTLAQVAREKGMLEESDIEVLDSWVKDPHKWSLSRGGE